MLTSKNGHSACMQRLLARGANISVSDPSDGRTALLIAVENGHVSCVRQMLASCAAAHESKTACATLQDGSNIYHLACKSDRGEAMLDSLLKPDDNSIVRLLHTEHQQTLETPNERGERPLHVAALAGRAAIVRRLLVAGANINAIDVRQWTPLMVACQVGSVETVGFLLDARADAFHHDSRGIAAPMVACISAAQPADRQAIIGLIRKTLHTPGALEIKGQTPVDPVCKMAAQCHVYCSGHARADDNDGTGSGAAYSALMMCADVAAEANDCQLLQLLEAEDGEEEAKRYYVWSRGGRLGVLAAPHTDLHGPMPLLEALKSFEEAFESVMGCRWEQRAACAEWRCAGAYVLLECNFSQRVATPESTLDPRTQELVKLIILGGTPGAHQEHQEALAQAAALSFDPCGLFEMFDPSTLSAASVERAGRALDEIAVVLKRSGSVQSPAATKDAAGPSSHATVPNEDASSGEDTARLLIALSSRFYSEIPTIPTSEVNAVNPVVRGGGVSSQALLGGRKLSVRAPLAPLPTIDCLEMVDALRLASLRMHSLDHEYAQLHTRLTPLDREGEVFAMLKQYVANTHAPTHTQYSTEVEDAFAVEREGEADAFRDVGNKQLLFHGSRLSNWRGILSSGLRIAPPEAPLTGYMFGKGIYFADMSSKSANYCYATRQSPHALLLVCEVALGRQYERLNACYEASVICASKGLHSTFGLGRSVPLEKDARWIDDVKMPMGKLSPNPHPKVMEGRTDLLYNEIVVYDPRQVKQRYLLSCRFHFNESE
jgi:poly [ADP-ribose] polymerase 2/3/4